jgi:phage baseplate assembly protein W
MAYQVISNQTEINNSEIALGVKLNFNNPGVFDLNYLSIDQAVDNLKNLLLTRIGERVHKVNFGTPLLDILFEPNVSNLKQDIELAVTDAIAFWLPYITIEEFDIVTAEDNPNLPHNISIAITCWRLMDHLNAEPRLLYNADENGVVNIE